MAGLMGPWPEGMTRQGDVLQTDMGNTLPLSPMQLLMDDLRTGAPEVWKKVMDYIAQKMIGDSGGEQISPKVGPDTAAPPTPLTDEVKPQLGVYEGPAANEAARREELRRLMEGQ